MSFRADQIPPQVATLVREGIAIDYTSASSLTLKTGAVVGSNDGKFFITSVAPLVANITSVGLGGRDSGVEAANTWYFIWFIHNPATEVEGLLLSVSDTSPILPSGFTVKQVIGSVYNNSAADFRRFRKRGKRVKYYEGQQAVNIGGFVNLTWSSVSLANYVPTTAELVSLDVDVDADGHFLHISEQDDEAPNANFDAVVRTGFVIMNGNRGGGDLNQGWHGKSFDLVLEDRNIHWYINEQNAVLFNSANIYVTGYKDRI